MHLLAVLTLVGTACQLNPFIRAGERPPFVADSHMARLQERGKITIGVKFDIPRFGFFNPATNELEGFDVDLGKIIAKRLGVSAEFKEAVSKDRIPLLRNDEVDLVISTMTINEERQRLIDFSVVYYVAQQQLLVRKDSKISGVDSLEERKASVCSARDSTSAANIATLAPNAPRTLLDTYSQCFQLLQDDQVEAVTTDNVILTSLLTHDSDNFKIVGKPFTVEPYGMGIKKGRPEFVAFINECIREIKVDGTWVRLYSKWVQPVTGETAQPPPDDVQPIQP